MPRADRTAKAAASVSWTSWAEPIVVLVAAAALSWRLYTLVALYAVNIFYMDQWDFNNATVFQNHSLWEMFRWEHGPHRQGLGAILANIVEPYFAWNSRVESFFVAGLIVASALCALWLKSRLFGRLILFDICVPLIFLNPLQFETLFITANLAHGPVPLLLILLYCLCWTIAEARWRYPLILLINFVTIYTGFGFFLGVITPLALAADYWLNLRHKPAGRLISGAAVLFSLASLASFFYQYVFQTAVDCSPNLLRDPWEYIQFLLLIFANLLGVQGIEAWTIFVGFLVMAAITAALLAALLRLRTRPGNDRPSAMITAILLSYCLIFAVNAAYGRSCTGLPAAQESRYIIYMETGGLGVYFCLLAMRRSSLRLVMVLILTAALLTTVPATDRDTRTMAAYSLVKQQWKKCYLRVEDIGRCNEMLGFSVYPRPERNDLKGKLSLLKERRQNLYSDVR